MQERYSHLTKYLELMQLNVSTPLRVGMVFCWYYIYELPYWLVLMKFHVGSQKLVFVMGINIPFERI